MTYVFIQFAIRKTQTKSLRGIGGTLGYCSSSYDF